MEKIITNIIFLNVLCDVLLIFSGSFSILRIVLLVPVLLYFLIGYRSRHGNYSWMLVLVIYTLLMIPLTSKPLASINMSMHVLLPMLGLMIGFNFFNTKSRILKLGKSIRAILILLIINFVVSNTLKLGQSTYTSGSSFLLGALHNHWGLYTYCILSFPLILKSDKNRRDRIISLVVLFFNVGLVFLSITRTAIFVMVLGSLIIFFFSYSFKNRMKVFGFSILTLLAAYPFVDGIITERFEARERKFRDGALEKEGRYIESILVWEKVLSFEEPEKSFFGLEAFNSVGNYTSTYNPEIDKRNLHIDYNLIVNTIGLVGLVIYFAMYYQIASRFLFFTNKLRRKTDFEKKLFGVFISFFTMQFVTSFGGAMHQISLRLIIYVVMGAVVGYFITKYKENLHDYQSIQNLKHIK